MGKNNTAINNTNNNNNNNNHAARRVLFSTTKGGDVLEERFRYDKTLPASARKVIVERGCDASAELQRGRFHRFGRGGVG